MKNLVQKERVIWKTANGRYLYIDEMATSHLFFSLRMIWNHIAPIDARMEPYKRYAGIANWSKKQISIAVNSLYSELMTRKDLKDYPSFIQSLEKMAAYITLNKLKELTYEA